VFTPSSGDWEIAYSFSCPDSPPLYQFGFVLAIYAGDGATKVGEIDQDAYSVNGTNGVAEHDLKGSFHITINLTGEACERTGCSWQVYRQGLIAARGRYAGAVGLPTVCRP
jgi:hypothetical protein